MDFKTFSDRMKANFNSKSENAGHLFEVEVDRDEIYNMYLDSFPAGTNEIFRERRSHDCSCCASFVRNLGKAVFIIDNQIHTIWGFDCGDPDYQVVCDAMDTYIKSKIICDVYHSNVTLIGTVQNKETTDDGDIIWEHLNVTLPSALVTRASEGSFKGDCRSTMTTFKSSLEAISEDSIKTLQELIASNSLYKGDEQSTMLAQFLKLRKEYAETPADEVVNWLWARSVVVGPVMSRIKNHTIGMLLQNITEGMDLETAVKKYEAMTAPENYKRPKPVYTKQMLAAAEKTVTDMGLLDSLGRRFAVPDDIGIEDVLFINRSMAVRMGVFAEMATTIPENPKKYDRVEEIGIEDFIANVLPTASEIEVMVENRHVKNLVSLIAPLHEGSRSLFKWRNNFGWAYAGNLADSSMKDNVKRAGGNVSGDLRFSIQWNDIARAHCDLDAHCTPPHGKTIYYANKCHGMNGSLDVDIMSPRENVPAVENIIYVTRSKMDDGVYRMSVHNFSGTCGPAGFRAEIEIDGVIHSFDYQQAIRSGDFVEVAEVTLTNGEFSIKPLIISEMQAREVWGMTTNQFIPVRAMCLSPNYWGEETGAKHYMFMLKDCINPDNPNGFFNDFLASELYEHRKVFEALGGMMRVEDCDEQLSGLGFASTKSNTLIVKVKGQTERIFKITI